MVVTIFETCPKRGLVLGSKVKNALGAFTMMTLEDIFVVLLVKEQISLDRVYPYMLHKYWLRYSPNSSQPTGILDTCSTENPCNQ